MQLDERRFTRKEAAQTLGVSLATLGRLHQQGRGPRRVQIGKRVMFMASDLEDYLRAHRA